MLKKVGILGGRQILKLGFFLGIEYEPLSDSPVIKICEWGPGGSIQFFRVNTCEVFLEHRLRHHKQTFGKIATTVVLDKDENLL